MSWIKKAGALVVLVAAGGALGLAIYARMALPSTSGELALSGSQGPIRIERDTHGIPTVVAQSAHDAYFGLGVVHAQDRLWQLETHRRIGAGRMQRQCKKRKHRAAYTACRLRIQGLR